MSAPQPTDQNFTEAENKLFAAKKSSLYKGSIAVCVVYGVLVLGLILLATLTESGKSMLTTELRTFVITLIVGILIVIAIIGIMIVSAKPSKIDTSLYASDVCPDYWKLQLTEEGRLKSMGPEAQILGKNVCIRDDTVLPSTGNVYNNNQDRTLHKNVMTEYVDKMLMQPTEVCNRVYPTALGAADVKKYPDNQNKMRCDIARKCGFAWTSVCP